MEEQENKKSDYKLQEEAAKQDQQQIEESTRSWLQTDNKVKEYLSRFRQDDVKHFLEQYPRLKGSFMYYGEKLGNVPEEHQLTYIEKAEKNLMDIQRKKIFDLMCRWDADELKLEGVVCSDDFDLWLEDPNTCPYISPVTNDEFALYLTFMETEEFEDSYYYMQLSYNCYRGNDPSDDSELYE